MALLSSFWTFDVVLVLLSAFVAAYFYMTRNFGYWKSKGVLEIPPVPFLGNFGSCLTLRIPVFEYLGSLYQKGKDLPYVGFYIFDKPALVLRDLDLIKSVLVQDFDSFSNRYVSTAESDILGYYNLFLIENPAWKKLRKKLTPTFTSGKIKAMFPLVDAVGDELNAHFEGLDLKGDGQVIELREICGNYTTDCIATCAFGLRVDSLNNPNSAFRAAGRKSFDYSFRRGIEAISHFFIPRLAKLFRFKFYEETSSKFLQNAFMETLNERSKSGLKRNDFVDLLIELRNAETETTATDSIEFTDKITVAQAALFFAAGFETSSTTTSFILHELSLQPDLQEKLRAEIRTALEENDGKVTYDMLHRLPYMDQVVWEGLRKYPALSFLDRVAQCDYTVAKTGLVIKKETPVYISLLGLHYDPEYFPNPDSFDPERFNAENKRKHPPFSYLPFGDGPHNCIGLRFGLIKVKTGLLKILKDFELTPCEQTVRSMHFDPKGFILKSLGDLYHRVRKIEETSD